MSHTVKVNMIADQEIEIGYPINPAVVNIHDIKTIVVNGDGKIVKVYLHKKEEEVD